MDLYLKKTPKKPQDPSPGTLYREKKSIVNNSIATCGENWDCS
jgi:hypothetical protein